jgi:hypothetical protein
VDPVSVAGHISRSAAMASAAAAGLVVMALVLVDRGAQRRPATRSALIPAYLPAGGVIDLIEHAARPRLVVINPHNGPGVEARPSYRDAVRVAHGSGTRVLGYVSTRYGARPAAEVLADVDRYVSWYRVDGIFFDECSSGEERLPYYEGLSRQVRSPVDRLVVLNPGAVPAKAYFDFADVVVTFEGPYSAYAKALVRMPQWLRREPREHVAHLVYGATRPQAMAALERVGEAGYVYVTSGSPPNPWRTVPPYLAEQEEALRAWS